MEDMRLQKYLAMCGVASRRHAEEMIKEGRVSVNGEKIERMGTLVKETDKVTVDGEKVSLRKESLTYIFYKPEKVMTTLSDPEGRPTVKDFFTQVPVRLYPIGRLDYQTEGLLLMTTDGDLAYRLTNPKNGMQKTYMVLIKGTIKPEQLQALRTGVSLQDGVTAPCTVYIEDNSDGKMWVKLIIEEEKNHQVRRMFEALGFSVISLKREAIGSLTLKDLKPGKWRRLMPHEEKLLNQE